MEARELNYTVELNRLRLYARHGVAEQEKTVGNTFEVTVSIELPSKGAVEAIEWDSLSGAANYGDIAAVIKHEMEVPSRLLEHVAGRIIKALHSAFPAASAIMVKVEKLTPPLGLQLAGASVTLRWNKRD